MKKTAKKSRVARAIMWTGAGAASALSYAAHGSIAWALAHGLCGWLYVAYLAATR